MKKYPIRSIPCLIGIALFISLWNPAFAGNLDPSAPPAPTMKTLDEIPGSWSRILAPADRFKSTFAGTAVLDLETGLVWTWTTLASDTWQNQIAACWNLNLGGRRGWRLPRVSELLSLTDNVTIPVGYFDDANIKPNQYMWTATENVSDAARAWGIAFFDTGGFSYNLTLLKTASFTAMCVRGGDGFQP